MVGVLTGRMSAAIFVDKHKVQYYAGCDPFMGLSYFNYGRKPALFSSSQIFF